MFPIAPIAGEGEQGDNIWDALFDSVEVQFGAVINRL